MSYLLATLADFECPHCGSVVALHGPACPTPTAQKQRRQAEERAARMERMAAEGTAPKVLLRACKRHGLTEYVMRTQTTGKHAGRRLVSCLACNRDRSRSWRARHPDRQRRSSVAWQTADLGRVCVDCGRQDGSGLHFRARDLCSACASRRERRRAKGGVA